MQFKRLSNEIQMLVKFRVNIDANYWSFKETNKQGRLLKSYKNRTKIIHRNTHAVKAIYVRVFVSRHTVYTEAI